MPQPIKPPLALNLFNDSALKSFRCVINVTLHPGFSTFYCAGAGVKVDILHQEHPDHLRAVYLREFDAYTGHAEFLDVISAFRPDVARPTNLDIVAADYRRLGGLAPAAANTPLDIVQTTHEGSFASLRRELDEYANLYRTCWGFDVVSKIKVAANPADPILIHFETTGGRPEFWNRTIPEFKADLEKIRKVPAKVFVDPSKVEAHLRAEILRLVNEVRDIRAELDAKDNTLTKLRELLK